MQGGLTTEIKLKINDLKSIERVVIWVRHGDKAHIVEDEDDFKL